MSKVLLDRANKAFIQSGSGVPDSNTRGNIYLDLDSSTIYIRITQNDPWTEVSGGGGDSFWTRDEGDETLTPTTATDSVLVSSLGSGVVEVDASAVVDLASTTKGFLVPRMTTTQRDNIISPATGLKIFNTTTGKENVYSGSLWEELISENVSFWSGTTTTASLTELFIAGISNNRYILEASSTTYFNLTCIARDNTNNKSKVWEVKAVAQIDGSNNSSIVGTPSYTVIAQSDLSGGTDDWDIAVSVNNTDESFRVEATGQAGTTISWNVRG